MPERRWTILIVPSDNGAPRSFTITERRRKALLWASGFAGALVLAAAAYLATPFATPATRLLMAENTRLRERLADLDRKLVALGDTITLLGQKDREIRAFAGLPEDSLAAVAGVTRPTPGLGDSASRTIVEVLPQAPRRKPFFGRLGFGSDAPEVSDLSRRAAALVASFSAVSDSLNRNLERLANTPSIMPTTGWLSSQYSQSRFHPVLHTNRPHEGIDVAAPMGTPIIAPAGGIVRNIARDEAGFGNTFEIDHGNGIVTRFAHCSRILVRDGQTVTRAQLIATVGNTGLSIGPHLHYEVHVNGQPVDPLKYVLPQRATEQH